MSVTRKRWWALGAVAVAAGCASAPLAGRVTREASPPASPCDGVASMRARAEAMAGEGRIDHAQRLLALAERRCPSADGRTSIGRLDAELAASPSSSSIADLLRDAAASRAKGDAPAARRSLDRALRAAEAEQGAHARLVALLPGLGGERLQFSPDQRHVLRSYTVAPDADTVTAILDANAPRFSVVALAPDLFVGGQVAGKIVMGTGREQVVFDVAHARAEAPPAGAVASDVSLHDDLRAWIDAGHELHARRPIAGEELPALALPGDLGEALSVVVVTSRVVAVAGGAVHLFVDVVSRTLLARVALIKPDEGAVLVASPDGAAAAALYGSGTAPTGTPIGVVLVDLRHARRPREVPNVAITRSAWLPKLVWTPDGATLVVVTGPRSAVLVDPKTGRRRDLSLRDPKPDRDWDSADQFAFADHDRTLCAAPSWYRATGERTPWIDLRTRAMVRERREAHAFCFPRVIVHVPRKGELGVTAPDREVLRSVFEARGTHDVEQLSPDQKTVALVEVHRKSELKDPHVLLVDVATGHVRASGALPEESTKSPILQLAFALGGRRLVVSWGIESRAFDVATGALVGTYPFGDTDYVAVEGDRYLVQGNVTYDLERGDRVSLGPATLDSGFEPLHAILAAEGIDAEQLFVAPKGTRDASVEVQPRGRLTLVDGGATCCNAEESFTFPLSSRRRPNLVARSGSTLAMWVTNDRDPGPLSFVDLGTGATRGPVELHVVQPGAMAWNTEGTRLLTVSRGVVQAFSPSSGKRLATLVTISKTLGVALLQDGRVEWIGEAGTAAERDVVACVVGRRVLPFEACEERLVVPSALTAALRGETGYLDP